MLKVGILGGSFDPIHNGHLIIAENALRAMSLDVVYFMPTAISPLKGHEPIASAVNRYKMIELAIRGYKKFDILDWEILKKSTSYTIETAKTLKSHWPNDRFFWIIGSDLIGSLDQWKDIHELVHLLEFIAIKRPGYSIDAPEIENLKIHPITIADIPISSSEIRERIKKKEYIKEMLPESVYNYIFINKIYE